MWLQSKHTDKFYSAKSFVSNGKKKKKSMIAIGTSA